MNILVVGGHPADMFDHCGGTLAHHIRQGDKVVCATVTPGLRCHDEVVYDYFRTRKGNIDENELNALLEERINVKYGEVKAACRLFGIEDIRFLDCDDEILCVTPTMISKMAMLIRDVQPDLVITHWPYEDDTFSNQHAVTGQLVLAGITAAHGVNFEQDAPSWNVAQIAYMISDIDFRGDCYTNVGKQPYMNYYVDVTDVVDLKVKAIDLIGSQKYNIPGYAKKTTETWNGVLGVRIRVPYAEGFALEWPEIGHTIPVSDHRMWLAKGDERELLEAISDLRAVDVEL